MKIYELKPVFVDGSLPEVKNMEEGVFYISESRQCGTHLCACGCKEECYTPFSGELHGTDEWNYINNNGLITIRPSIGNWHGQDPYHAHYLITENKVTFV